MEYHKDSYVPIEVEYYPHYPSTIGKTFVRTDVSVREAFEKNTTLAKLAVEHCKNEGLNVTGNAKISTNGIFAPEVITCVFKGNCRTIDFGSPCEKIDKCELR